MSDDEDIGNAPRGCLLALGLSCVLWAVAAAWVAWSQGWWRP